MFFQRLAPEFTHLSLSLVSCFEFTSRIATMDSIETISRFGKGLYSSTDGVTAGGRIFNNFLWSPLSWEPRGFLINTLMVSRKIIPWTACGPGSILNILALLLLSFQFWKIKEKRKEERMKGKIKKGGEKGGEWRKQWSVFLASQRTHETTTAIRLLIHIAYLAPHNMLPRKVVYCFQQVCNPRDEQMIYKSPSGSMNLP